MEIGPDIGLFTDFVKENYNKFYLFEPNVSVKNSLESIVANEEYSIVHEMEDFSSVQDNFLGHYSNNRHRYTGSSFRSVLFKKFKKEIKKSNSKLLIVTHNEKSLLRYIFQGKWPAFCLQHPQYFLLKLRINYSKKQVLNVLTKEELNEIILSKFLIKHVLWAIGVKISNIPDFFGLTIGLKLGNIITVATPKRLDHIFIMIFLSK